MSYTPTTWQTGDTITAEKLNNMESGIENANEPFVITLTPTAQDYSGTMDKTVAEIDAAYRAGQKIIFRVYVSTTVYMEIDCTYRGSDASVEYPSFNASFVTSEPFHAFVYIYTGITDNGTENTYSTTIYPLTPMS